MAHIRIAKVRYSHVRQLIAFTHALITRHVICESAEQIFDPNRPMCSRIIRFCFLSPFGHTGDWAPTVKDPGTKTIAIHVILNV